MKTFLLSTVALWAFYTAGAQDLQWAARLGGSSFEQAYGIAADAAGNVYTTGSFEGTADFNPGPGTANLTSVGDADVFISKLNSSGQFVWAIRFGGTTEDYSEALMVDHDGNLYVIGYFNGTSDFDPGPGTTNLTAAGSYDMYVAKFDLDGNFQWARRIGGTDFDQHYGIALDSTGNIVLTGRFSGTADFDPGVGTLNLFSQGGFDVGIYKLSAAGQLVWAKRFGGISDDVPRGLAIDKDNNILLTGRFEGIVDFNPGGGTNNLESEGGEDIFLLKLDAAGNFSWVQGYGSASDDEGLAITAHPDGTIYTTGFFFQSIDFDPGPGTETLTSEGDEDVYVQKLDGDGNLIWVKQIGGDMLQKAHAIVTDTSGNTYLSGYFSGTMDLDPGADTSSVTSLGGLDAFVLKLNPGGNHLWDAHFAGESDVRSQRMTVNPVGEVYAMGYFLGSADFDPGPDTETLTAAGQSDAFVVSLTNLCQATSATISPIACDRYTSPDGAEVWTESGTYMDTLLNAEGCDSIITVQLTVNHSSTFSFDATACDVYVSPDGLATWTESGLYLDTIPNASGCDSVITINLTILESSEATLEVTACDSYTSPGGAVWTESGVYQDLIPNAVGCDSLITIDLTIAHSTSFSFADTGCDAYMLPDSHVVTASGIYEVVIPNAAGCDSLITLELTMLMTSASFMEVVACDSFVSPSGNYTWTKSGLYIDVLENAVGCDSLISIQLTVPVFNTNVSYTMDGTTLRADMESAEYQWVDCDNGFQPIPGATSQSFTPEDISFYAVIITDLGCSDTSDCYVVTQISTENPADDSGIQVYPNPFDDVLFLETTPQWSDGLLSIIDSRGVTLRTIRLQGMDKTEIPLNIPPGLYLIRLDNGSQTYMRKQIRQ